MRLEAEMISTLPYVSIGPTEAELPLDWRDEESGQLQTAVIAFLRERTGGPPIGVGHFNLVKAYLSYVIKAPGWSLGDSFLVEMIGKARTSEDLDRFINACMQIGIDPL